MFAAIATAVIMRRRPVKRFWPYVLGPGVLSWWALYVSGVHPALALVPIIPFLPHASRDAGLFVDARPQAHDALTSFERWWRLPVQGVLLMFGLVNAGVPLTGHEAGMWALPLTVIIGRPIGVMLASGIGVACGLRLPSHVGWRDVAVAGCITSVGFVMALFFATVAMPIGPLLAQLKIGALLSIIGAVVAIVTARILGVGRYGVARRAS